ncbi:transposase, MuDR, MULE transposase domain protein, partial [Tanacetum coccineum]
PSTPPSYSPGPSTPSRNAECSNCKLLFEKIKLLEATVEMYMHLEQHTLNSTALLHEVYNDMGKLGLEYDFQKNEFSYKKEPHFTKPESSFAFGSYDENEDEQNDCNDGVDERPQPIYHKWKNFMSFKLDILETPLYKSKPMISKHYNKQTEVEVGNIFDNKEALDLAIRLKALDDGYHFLSNKSALERYELKCYHFNECAWSIRARRWGNIDKFHITFLNDVHTCPKTQTYPNHRNANKKVIAHIVTPKLQDNRRVLKGKDIQQEILSEYKINISYQQAWRGKEYAIQQIRGSPFEYFEMLPYYCHNLEKKPRDSHMYQNNRRRSFEMLFITVGASIRSFVNYLRPLLIIDAVYLKGQYIEGLVGDNRRLGEVCSKRVHRILMAQCGRTKTDDVENGADFFSRQL